MSPVDDTLDGIVLRWPKPQQEVKPRRRTIRQRLDWLALPTFIIRLAVECLGWVALVGMASMWF